uniref:ribosomal protein S4 n=1 Tax=Ishige okamurae TaxID=233772 RepID=UPI002E77AAA6|nr:ribosomal protein S4 [Ishige okamurae]WBP70190.1 ribosomal protein S4 [Ishige okamurae]
MRLKIRYKSCLWTKTDIWGNLLRKQKSFLSPKWDRMLGILRYRKSYWPGKKVLRGGTIINYNFLKPKTRPNMGFKNKPWGYRNLLSSRFCVQRFHGDIKYKAFLNFCHPLSSEQLQVNIERRLDTLLYRIGFFSSVSSSRQAILHGKVLVNNQKIARGNFIARTGDLVHFPLKMRPIIKQEALKKFKTLNLRNREVLKKRKKERSKVDKMIPTPHWIQTDYSNLCFMICKDGNLKSYYPFRADFDQLSWYSSYGNG